MLAAALLILHAAAALYAFLKYKKESTNEGLLAVAFFAILFAVGWTISTTLMNQLFNTELVSSWYASPSGSTFTTLAKKELNRDTVSLLVLTAGEIVFYYFYLRTEKKPEKRSTSA
ncbi:MAG: hypothetical protein HYY49_12370 [Ignavibacteriales bacterium]|nr:hypothetical protein [Ignavibacteriales bacterium]